MDIGSTIRNLRKERKLSQKVFAGKTGISQTYLSQLETNKRTPSDKLIKVFCKSLHISIGGFYMISLTVDDVPKNKRGIFDTFKPTLHRIFLL